MTNDLPIHLNSSKEELVTCIQEMTLKILDVYSGGIKFTELITEIMSTYRDRFSESDLSSLSPELIEEAIRSSETVKVLDYTWGQINRSKMFVYTP